MKDTAILKLIANMPNIVSMVTELNTLLNSLPKDSNTDLIVTIGKSSVKLNSKKDEELYNTLFENITNGTVNKIWKLRDNIDSLLYPSDEIKAIEEKA